MSVGIFFAACKIGMVYSFMVPSIGVLCLVTGNAKICPARARVYLESSNLVCRHIFCSLKNGIVNFLWCHLLRYFVLCPKCKKGPARARVHIESLNFLCRHIFAWCHLLGYLKTLVLRSSDFHAIYMTNKRHFSQLCSLSCR